MIVSVMNTITCCMIQLENSRSCIAKTNQVVQREPLVNELIKITRVKRFDLIIYWLFVYEQKLLKQCVHSVSIVPLL